MLRRCLSDLCKLLRVRRPHHKHQIAGAAPLLRSSDHLIVQRRSVFLRRELKIGAAGIRCERQHNGPLSWKFQKRRHRIAAHVRRHRYRIKAVFFKKSLRIQPRGIADVAALGIRNGENARRHTVHGSGQRMPAVWTQGFKKSEIGFVGHTEIVRCLNDGFIKFKNRVVQLQQVGRQFVYVWIKADAEERLLAADLPDEFLARHTLFFAKVVTNP